AGFRKECATRYAGDRFRRTRVYAEILLSLSDYAAALQQHREFCHLAEQTGEVDGRAGGSRGRERVQGVWWRGADLRGQWNCRSYYRGQGSRQKREAQRQLHSGIRTARES